MNLEKKVEMLILKNSNKSFQSFICISIINTQYTAYIGDYKFLNEKEKLFLSTMKYEKRIHSYLLGRYAAKNAVARLLGINQLNEIVIEQGIFGQPVLNGTNSGGSEVSISHCDNIGVAVAFPQYISMGVDIEKIDSGRLQLLNKIITDEEKLLLDPSKDDTLLRLTLIWSVKEALSKCIKTGFTVPMDFFSIKNISINEEIYQGCFLNFIQYQYICFKRNDYLISIVYPKNIEIVFDEKNFFKEIDTI